MQSILVCARSLCNSILRRLLIRISSAAEYNWIPRRGQRFPTLAFAWVTIRRGKTCPILPPRYPCVIKLSPSHLPSPTRPSSWFGVAHCVRDVRAKDRSAILHLYFADCRYSFRFINLDRVSLRELIARPRDGNGEKSRREKRITAARRRCTYNLIISISRREEE